MRVAIVMSDGRLESLIMPFDDEVARQRAERPAAP